MSRGAVSSIESSPASFWVQSGLYRHRFLASWSSSLQHTLAEALEEAEEEGRSQRRRDSGRESREKRTHS